MHGTTTTEAPPGSLRVFHSSSSTVSMGIFVNKKQQGKKVEESA